MRLSSALATCAAIAALVFLDPALASEAGTGLEWEGPIDRVVRSFTGPVAFAGSFLGICVAGLALVWGGQINEFVRSMFTLMLVVALIMFAGNILRRLFVGGASTITPPAVVLVIDQAARHE